MTRRGGMRTDVLGLDVGGANLKAVHVNGTARTQPFALWKQPGELAHKLSELLESMPPFHLLAVTMTAELCDCYATKREGVHAVLDAVEDAARTRAVLVWQNDGELVVPAAARNQTLKTAAANWLALATLAGRYCSTGFALLIDIGSTTTDIVPIVDRRPKPQGRTDSERMLAGELIYIGVLRTPICAVLPTIRWRGGSCRPAAEWFATTRDVYLLLGDLPEDALDCDTADGRPATRAFAHARMARLLCADIETVSIEDAVALAQQARQGQVTALHEGLLKVQESLPRVPRTIVLSGTGEFLAREVVHSCGWPCEIVSLAKELGPEVSRAACAYALAVLAAERS